MRLLGTVLLFLAIIPIPRTAQVVESYSFATTSRKVPRVHPLS